MGECGLARAALAGYPEGFTFVYHEVYVVDRMHRARADPVVDRQAADLQQGFVVARGRIGRLFSGGACQGGLGGGVERRHGRHVPIPGSPMPRS